MVEGQAVLQLVRLQWQLQVELQMLALYGDREKEEIRPQECGHIQNKKFLITRNGPDHRGL